MLCVAPQEEKFRSINLDNNAYKNRVATCIGGTSLLKSVGFAKEESRLYMSMEVRVVVILVDAVSFSRACGPKELVLSFRGGSFRAS